MKKQTLPQLAGYVVKPGNEDIFDIRAIYILEMKDPELAYIVAAHLGFMGEPMTFTEIASKLRSPMPKKKFSPFGWTGTKLQREIRSGRPRIFEKEAGEKPLSLSRTRTKFHNAIRGLGCGKARMQLLPLCSHMLSNYWDGIGAWKPLLLDVTHLKGPVYLVEEREVKINRLSKKLDREFVDKS